jgi:hypothetical protein
MMPRGRECPLSLENVLNVSRSLCCIMPELVIFWPYSDNGTHATLNFPTTMPIPLPA